MPRSLWNGTIVFGQVNVPVKLYSAVQSKTVSFREVHLADGARIEHRRFCTEENEEISYMSASSPTAVELPSQWVSGDSVARVARHVRRIDHAQRG